MQAPSRTVLATSVEDWFGKRSYDRAAYGAPDRIGHRKRELGLTLSVVLPAREVAGTIGAIIDEISTAGRRTGLVDQLLVVDADSADGTADVAARHGAEVYQRGRPRCRSLAPPSARATRCGGRSRWPAGTS